MLFKVIHVILHHQYSGISLDSSATITFFYRDYFFDNFIHLTQIAVDID